MTASADPIRVLHVDDDGEFASLSARFLERQGDRFDATSMADPTASLEYVAEHPVDCVVSDYEMPELDGLELLSAVRERDPELPFVLFTGKGSESVASEAISAGVTDYLQKRAGSGQFQVLANRIANAVGRYRAERALERERDRFSALFENFPEPTVAYAYRGSEPIVEAVNDAFVEVFGYDADVAVGTPIDELVVPDDHLEEATRVDERVQAGERIDAELVRLTVDGRRHFRFRNIALPVETGPDGFAVYADISERKARQADLERENERLEEFVSVISHDLRNPLSVAAGSLETVRREMDHEALDTLDHAIGRMDEIVDQTLTLARSGQVVGETELVSLGRIATQSWRSVPTGSAELELDAKATVRADPGRLRHLFENLFRNAIEHASMSDSVTVRVTVHGDGFAVTDDGPGIPDADREDVFQAGYTTADGGTGLGLAIVNRIAESHDWTVTIGENESGGARVAFSGVDRATVDG